MRINEQFFCRIKIDPACQSKRKKYENEVMTKENTRNEVANQNDYKSDPNLILRTEESSQSLKIKKNAKYPDINGNNKQVSSKVESDKRHPHRFMAVRYKPRFHYQHNHKKTMKKPKNKRPGGQRKPKVFRISGILQRSKLGRYFSNFQSF